MQVKLELRTLALGIALGAAAASWHSPAPAQAAEREWAYKAYLEQPKGGVDELNKQAMEGWEPIGFVQTAAGTKVYLRRPD